MGMARKNVGIPDKKLAAVCGLFCPACRVFIGTREEPERLERLAEQFHYPVEEMKCDGCRSDRRGPYCKICKMSVCAAEKGIDFCGECEEYPCEDLRKFQAAMPHRIELWSDQERIQEVGYERWFVEKLEEYSCPQCGTLNSAYDLTCRKCGHDPSCEYVRRNGEAVVQHLAKRA